MPQLPSIRLPLGSRLLSVLLFISFPYLLWLSTSAPFFFFHYFSLVTGNEDISHLQIAHSTRKLGQRSLSPPRCLPSNPLGKNLKVCGDRRREVRWGGPGATVSRPPAAYPSPGIVSGSFSPATVPWHLAGRTTISLKETVLGK